MLGENKEVDAHDVRSPVTLCCVSLKPRTGDGEAVLAKVSVTL